MKFFFFPLFFQGLGFDMVEVKKTKKKNLAVIRLPLIE